MKRREMKEKVAGTSRLTAEPGSDNNTQHSVGSLTGT